MGRPKKEKAEKPAKAKQRTAEDLNDEELATLTYHHKAAYERDLKAKKAADAQFKNSCKKAVADLGAEVIDDIKMLIEHEADEAVAEKKYSDRIKRILRVAKMAGATLDVQLDMFAGAKSKHYEDGKRSGMQGQPRTPPQHLSANGSEYQDWLKGHADGNDARNAALAGEGEDEDERPAGTTHADWQARLRAQNEATDRAIKGH